MEQGLVCYQIREGTEANANDAGDQGWFGCILSNLTGFYLFLQLGTK